MASTTYLRFVAQASAAETTLVTLDELVDRANSLSAAGNHEQALDVARQAVELAAGTPGCGFRPAAAAVLVYGTLSMEHRGIGHTLVIIQDNVEFLECALSREISLDHTHGAALALLAQMHEILHRGSTSDHPISINEKERHLERALAIHRLRLDLYSESGEPVAVAQIHLAIARTLDTLHRPYEAVEALVRAAKDKSTLSSTPEIARGVVDQCNAIVRNFDQFKELVAALVDEVRPFLTNDTG